MSEMELIFSVKKSSEGGYEARALDHSIFTQAETMDELKLNVSEAVRCHFDDGEPLPAIRLVEARRIFGSAKGKFTVPDDFNDPLPKEIEDLFW
jgi:predicted RNase H-like HicB family nuclease